MKASAVPTPSCRTFRSGFSFDRSNVHISNPNPQGGKLKFLGIRELGYKDFLKKQNPLDIVSKFGKKVAYDQKYTNE